MPISLDLLANCANKCLSMGNDLPELRIPLQIGELAKISV
jgi:hypothetical protein